MGSRTDQRAWRNPDVWARDLLEGGDRELATMIWRQSGGEVNPRYTKGAWDLVSRYKLLVVDRTGYLTLTDAGRDFLDEETGKTVTLLDKSEGLVELLALIADKGAASRQDLLPDWRLFLRSCSSPFCSSSTRKSSLGFRLKNLTDRGLVATVRRDYRISVQGRRYLSQAYPTPSPDTSVVRELP